MQLCKPPFGGCSYFELLSKEMAVHTYSDKNLLDKRSWPKGHWPCRSFNGESFQRQTRVEEKVRAFVPFSIACCVVF